MNWTREHVTRSIHCLAILILAALVWPANEDRLAATCGLVLAHTPCSHELAEGWLAQGMRLPSRPEEAGHRYLAASRAGDPRGDCGLAWMAEHGVGRGRDLVEAAERYEASARAGNACAQYYLANLHERGALGRVELDQAAHWYQAAARSGDADAASRLEVVRSRLTALSAVVTSVTHNL